MVKSDAELTSFFLILTQRWVFFIVFERERERGRGRRKEREGERNTDVRKQPRFVAFLSMPWPGIEPSTWVRALTGKQTCNLSVYRSMLQPTEPVGQGKNSHLFDVETSIFPTTPQWKKNFPKGSEPTHAWSLGFLRPLISPIFPPKKCH